MFTFITLFAFLFTVGSSSPFVEQLNSDESYKIQAVLIAGSNEFYNYRHQSDVCHAYHVLRNHGVPSENIIVMMYDDIANNVENPIMGKIYNQPNGPDVYEGVNKDYTGKDVNRKNFMGVLKGDKDLVKKGKKVLTTGPNDHVFIYFSDHGAPGILGMPDDDYLTSQDINETLTYMHKNKLYGKLTFYVEACESGSMFQNSLPDNMNIYATTASRGDESSYGAYCDVEGELDGTCLGDEYSVAWMEDSDAEDITKETLEQQFKNVVKNTPSSRPQEYGQKSVANLDVGEFQGEKSSSQRVNNRVPVHKSVNSRDVPLHALRSKLSKTNNLDETRALKKQLSVLKAGRSYLKRTIGNVVRNLCSAGYCSSLRKVFIERKPLVNHRTWHEIANSFAKSCINFSKHTDALKYMYTLVNIMENNQLTEATLPAFIETLEKSCKKHFANNKFQAII